MAPEKMSVRPVSSKDFYETVMKSSPHEYIFVDFCADWCQPCKKIAPKIHQLAQEYDQVTFLQVDADRSEDLMFKYGVESIPSFLLFKRGDLCPVIGIRGAQLEKIKEALRRTKE
jgi:thioredoxin 1